MAIMSVRGVFTTLITRYGKSLCNDRLPYTYDEALFIFSITSSRYRVATAKTQPRFSIIIVIDAHNTHHSYAIISRSLKIPMVQVVDAHVP